MPFESELKLRLADVASILAAVKTDEDGEMAEEHTGGILSALDYAIRGDSGCLEPDEWAEGRQKALREFGEYIGVA